MVRLENLKKAIKSSKYNTGVQVTASVTDLKGNTKHELITLRPVFVRIIRSYIEGQNYKSGKNNKIRFYDL